MPHNRVQYLLELANFYATLNPEKWFHVPKVISSVTLVLVLSVHLYLDSLCREWRARDVPSKASEQRFEIPIELVFVNVLVTFIEDQSVPVNLLQDWCSFSQCCKALKHSLVLINAN